MVDIVSELWRRTVVQGSRVMIYLFRGPRVYECLLCYVPLWWDTTERRSEQDRAVIIYPAVIDEY